MINRIRLKNPIWVFNPDTVHELLKKVESQIGGTWETDGITYDKGYRIYAFIRYNYEQGGQI